MSFLTTACKALTVSLVEMAKNGMNGPSTMSKTGLVQALVSPVNRQGFAYEQLQGSQGRVPKVDITYLKQRAYADVSLTQLDVCATTQKSEPVDTLFTVGLTASIEDSWDLNDFQDFCAWGVQRHQEYLIQSMLNPLFESIDRQLMAKFATTVGDYYNSTNAAQTFNVLTGSPVAADWAEFKRFLNAYELIRGNGNPIIVGDGNIDIYMSLVQMGCCNLHGIDLSQAKGDAFYFKDVFASTVLGANNFLAWSPGAAQMIQWLEYQPGSAMNYIKEDDAQILWTLPAEMGGIKVDVKMHTNNCTNVTSMTMTSHFDLFNMPADMYTDAAMIGVNGSLRAIAALVP